MNRSMQIVLSNTNRVPFAQLHSDTTRTKEWREKYDKDIQDIPQDIPLPPAEKPLDSTKPNHAISTVPTTGPLIEPLLIHLHFQLSLLHKQ